jgi:AraC-like DNA-binding protein
MSDFASAAMLRVLHAGMRRLGLPSPAQQWLEKATVPLDAKQQLVGQVLRERGLGALLHLGQGLHDVQHDSLMPVLIHRGEPLRVLHAWLRLERYLHSRHRIRQTVLGECAVMHSHISLIKGSAPSGAEDLVVIGVLIGLLQSAGCSQVCVALADGLPIWPVPDDRQQDRWLSDALEKGQTHTWQMSWNAIGLGQTLLVQSMPEDLPTSLSERLQKLIQTQHGQACHIDEVASLLGQSTRSLQRYLKAEGARYVDLVANVRVERAAQWLSEGQISLAEIGFACGYTDQAHFCRDFKRRVGMSPLRYREHAQSAPA